MPSPAKRRSRETLPDLQAVAYVDASDEQRYPSKESLRRAKPHLMRATSRGASCGCGRSSRRAWRATPRRVADGDGGAAAAEVAPDDDAVTFCLRSAYFHELAVPHGGSAGLVDGLS